MVIMQAVMLTVLVTTIMTNLFFLVVMATVVAVTTTTVATTLMMVDFCWFSVSEFINRYIKHQKIFEEDHITDHKSVFFFLILPRKEKTRGTFVYTDTHKCKRTKIILFLQKSKIAKKKKKLKRNNNFFHILTKNQ